MDSSLHLQTTQNVPAVLQLLGGIEAAELFRINLAQNESKVSPTAADVYRHSLISVHTQREAVKGAVGRLLSSGQNDCWILNTVFAVDEFSFVESLTVSLLDWTASDLH